MKKFIYLLLIPFCFLLWILPVQAAPKVMADGGIFDAEFYANAYSDVKAAFGNDEQALYNHYKTFGKREGRHPVGDVKTDEAGNPMHRSVGEQIGAASGTGCYVEVSISQQHVWIYVDGAIVLESDTVTGWAGWHDTPCGVYHVMEKINGKTLKGDDYETWVNKWMRLTYSGIGLHDAYWRNKFGGTVYQNNGSHGCINLPPKVAYSLYDMISVGSPVIVY